MTQAIVEASSASAPTPAHRDRSRWVSDLAIGAGLVLFTVVAHPVGQILSRPFWEDESWVAVLTRVRWSALPSFTSSTPLGWLALVRLVPGEGLQRSRLLVLAFAMAGTLAAYVITRRMTWPSRRAARLAGGMVALVVASVPIALVQNSLKQYTADAFFALVLLGFGSWCEHDQRPRTLVWLGVAAVVAMPFSTTSAFVSVAVFVAVVSLAVLARDFVRVRAIVLVGGIVAVAFLSYFVAFVIPGDTPALRDFWYAHYLDVSPSLPQQIWNMLERVESLLAMPAAVAVALFGVAIVMLWRRGERAIAIAMPVLWIEMIILGAARHYPFLVPRTAQFLLIPSIMVIAIGAVDVLFFVARRRPRIAMSAAFGLVLLLSIGVRSSWRTIGVPPRDPRSQTEYVAAHMRAGDVVLLNLNANWGFAYYWPHGHLDLKRRRDLANGFVAEVRGINAVYAEGGGDAQVRQAVHTALDRQHRSAEGRLFIVRSDMSAAEQARWDKALAAEHVSPSVVLSGPEPLLVVGR